LFSTVFILGPDDGFIISRRDMRIETIFSFYYAVAIHLDRDLVFFLSALEPEADSI
jgi:hypothetical protein